MHSFVQSLQRIWVIVVGTQRLWLRQRLFASCGGLVIAVLVALRAAQAFDFGGSQFGVAVDLLFSAFVVFGGGLAIAMPICTLASEREMGATHMLLAKGLRHREYVAGNLIGHSLALGCVGLILTLGALLCGPLWVSESPAMRQLYSMSSLPTFGYALAVAWIKLTVLVALALTVASYTKGLAVALVQTMCLTLICHLHEVMAAIQMQTASRFLVLVLRITRWLSPDLACLSLSDRIAEGRPILLDDALCLTGYGLMCSTLLGILAASLFARRGS